MVKAPVSVMIFTLNEEIHLPSCLDALGWADDVIVVDSFSTDSTEAICRERGARFFQNRFQGIGSVSAAMASALARPYSLLAGIGTELSPGTPETAARNAIAGRVSEPVMDS